MPWKKEYRYWTGKELSHKAISMRSLSRKISKVNVTIITVIADNRFGFRVSRMNGAKGAIHVRIRHLIRVNLL